MELNGMDLPEMGVLAYPDFVGTHEGYGSDDAAVPAGDRSTVDA